MKLTFFGRLRDAVGAAEIDFLPPENIVTSEDLRSYVGAQYPALIDDTVRIALDDVLVSDPRPIAGVAEIAFLPPVSGG